MLNLRLIIEASVVGIITIIVGFISFYICYKIAYDTNFFDNHSKEMKLIIISLFVTGFIIHLLCEYSGINKWYCTNGNACM